MSLRVLLLDDDESLAREIEHALVQRAYEVVTVADAEQGMGAASSQRFDVILVSNDLRGADASEVCDRIKNDPITASVPLVVVSKPVAISDLIASLPEPPGRRSSATSLAPTPSMAPSGDLRETIKNQARTVTSLRSDLAARSKTIETLTTRCKELTQKLTDATAQLDVERKERELLVATLETIRHNHNAELQAFEARRTAEATERDQAHAEETAFLERAHEDAIEAAARRLKDSEQNLVVERATRVADSEAHTFELSTFRDLVSSLERERDEAIRERDEARTQLEGYAMDVAQAQMDLAEETRNRTAGAQANASRIADLEQALAAQTQAETVRAAESERMLVAATSLEAQLADSHAQLVDMARKVETVQRESEYQKDLVGRASHLEMELADARTKLAEMAKSLDNVEREAAQQQLARDAAFHDMSLRAQSELQAAVEAAKASWVTEREELLRQHEAQLKVTRDKAIAQTLAVARERKKQQ